MVVDLTNRYKINEEKGIVKYTVKAHGEYYTGVAKTNFEEGDVLVLNNTKVLQNRLYGYKEDTGAKIEVFLLKEIENDVYECLIRPQKRVHSGVVIKFDDELLDGDINVKEYFPTFSSVRGYDPSPFNMGIYCERKVYDVKLRSTQYVGVVPLMKREKGNFQNSPNVWELLHLQAVLPFTILQAF